MKKLKPCPFCGEYPELSFDIIEDEKGVAHDCHIIMCVNEDCHASVVVSKETREDTIEAWNHRKLRQTDRRENTLHCKIPAHVVKWDTFDSVSLMTAIELYILGFGFTGIARELKKDRSSLVYQVRNILFGVKKSRYLVEEEVLAYRKMYNKEIEFCSRLKFENRYEL